MTECRIREYPSRSNTAIHPPRNKFGDYACGAVSDTLGHPLLEDVLARINIGSGTEGAAAEER